MQRFKSTLNDKGLTLLEVLIATTILAFLTISLVQMTDSGITTKERITREDEELTNTERTLLRLEMDFSMAFTPLYFSYLETKKPLTLPSEAISRFEAGNDKTYNNTTEEDLIVPVFESLNSNSFRFLTTSNHRRSTQTRQSQYAWVIYSLRESEIAIGNYDKPLYELVRYIKNENIYSLENIEIDDLRPTVLLDNISSLEFSYFDEKKEKFVENFAEISDRPIRFLAVKIKLNWVDENGNMNIEEKIIRPYFPLQNVASLKKTKEELQKGVNPTQ